MVPLILPADPASVTARVQNGVVSLAGHLRSAEQNDLIRIAVRLTWDIDGVVEHDLCGPSVPRIITAAQYFSATVSEVFGPALGELLCP